MNLLKEDFLDILDLAPNEIAGLKLALIEGRVNGSTYEGKYSCLVGIIANIRGCNYKNVKQIKPDASCPAERWFLAIKQGDTPLTNQVSQIIIEWIEEWEK